MRNFYPAKAILNFVIVAAFSTLIISCSKSQPKPPVNTEVPVTINAFVPAKGLPNTIVTITGTNFSTIVANNTVTFSGVIAKVNSVTASQMVVTVPVTATSGKIEIVSDGKKTVSATNFTVTTGTMNDYAIYSGIEIDQIKFDGTGRMFGADGTNVYEIKPGAQQVYYTKPPVSNFTGFAADATGNLYIPLGSAVLKVSPEKNVSVLAGTINDGGIIDGTGSSAKLAQSLDLPIDASGNLYYLDAACVRKITPAGVVTTIAGNKTGDRGYIDGKGNVAKFGVMTRAAVDPAGNLYVVDSDHFRIRKITSEGEVSTVIGNGLFGLTDGEGTNAQMFGPQSLVSDKEGNIFFSDADFENHLYRIRMLNKLGQVVTLISGNTISDIVNGPIGIATTSRPLGLAFDANGNLYIVNSGVHKISKVTFN
ncbi:IPT/TIG domain-containing protein [Mucilaginibacter gossypiicola]|uniref:IPT/TIG domain-containing protein n=1 Tax=Mucilaginibacter gossypiicola TaxID=551995 RepID=A0A1H8Q4E5_9SPHI|nr:IPT/TIG domain-containing protein [Mucilaginibacter gossypiicola]SEO48936.1 IPT/TIG domain-containing protein [Mucilaginibacter gossypiicola]